jgi:hypothetical protein
MHPQLATPPLNLHLIEMRADFSLFRERLAEACRARGRTERDVCQQIGLGSRRAISVALTGPNSIDLWRLCQIAEVLEVSLDWLVGRSNVMSVMEMPEFDPKPLAKVRARGRRRRPEW